MIQLHTHKEGELILVSADLIKLVTPALDRKGTLIFASIAGPAHVHVRETVEEVGRLISGEDGS